MMKRILIKTPADLKELEGNEGFIEVIGGKTYFCCEEKKKAEA